jgi:hypothetical protein
MSGILGLGIASCVGGIIVLLFFLEDASVGAKLFRRH